MPPGQSVLVCVWVAQVRSDKLGILVLERPLAGIRLVPLPQAVAQETPEVLQLLVPAFKTEEAGKRQQEEGGRGSWRRRPREPLPASGLFWAIGSPGPGLSDAGGNRLQAQAAA